MKGVVATTYKTCQTMEEETLRCKGGTSNLCAALQIAICIANLACSVMRWFPQALKSNSWSRKMFPCN
jgi:hypothetical protein